MLFRSPLLPAAAFSFSLSLLDDDVERTGEFDPMPTIELRGELLPAAASPPLFGASFALSLLPPVSRDQKLPLLAEGVEDLAAADDEAAEGVGVAGLPALALALEPLDFAPLLLPLALFALPPPPRFDRGVSSSSSA